MKKFIALIFAALFAAEVWAHQYEATVNGVTWYYNLISDGKGGYNAEITYRGYSSYDYSNRYSGSLVIPSTLGGYKVTTIGWYAFSNCSSLASVTIPDSVTSIGEDAFEYCSSLKSVTIPDSVTTIGSSAFFGTPFYNNQPDGLVILENGYLYTYKGTCPSSVTIPEGVTKIGEYAFSWCGSLTSITIPNSVTTIGSDAFYDCSSLTSITIPDSVTTIESHAFCGCSSLTSVTIPDSVTTIGSGTFYGCSSLTSVTIPEGVTKIGEYAFSWCGSLTSITIPDSVTEIGSGTFYGCSSLKEFVVGENNSNYRSINGLLCTKDGKRVVFGVNGDVTIPDSVATIGDSAFYWCSSLTSVTIPDSVTTIGSYAFYLCSSLTSVTIPDSVTDIGREAFSWCSSLVSVTIPEGVKSIKSYAFYNCSSLASVTIPDSITAIEEYAFYNCSSLTSVVIPDSVTTIGDYAFYGCSSLTSVTIPDSVTKIGKDAFSGCSLLTSITIPDCVMEIGYGAFNGCSSLTSVTIPESVTTIGDFAFSGCSSLTEIVVDENNDVYRSIDGAVYSKNGEILILCPAGKALITIPNNVTTIGPYAFYLCSSLLSVTIPDSVTIAGYKAFDGCSSLISFTSSSGVTEISDYMFRGCSSLTSITIPDGVATIGDSAFSGCSSLTSVTIPNSVTTIGSNAFECCSSLTSVTIPDSVTTIGENAFFNCSSLKDIYIKDLEKWCFISFGSCQANPFYYANHIYLNEDEIKDLIIPGNVKTIRRYAFSGCSSLTSITIPDSVTMIENGAFYECKPLMLKEVIGWMPGCPANVERIVISNSVKMIGSLAFYNCSSLLSVTIPDSVVTIESNAFSGCSSLTSVTIPDSVTTIENGAFSGCSSLTAVTMPESVTTIENGVFSGCDSLISVTMPDGLTKIGYKAFYNCSSLESVTIPNGVMTIGEDAFYGCGSLASVTIPDGVTMIGEDAFLRTPFYDEKPDGLVVLGRVLYKYKGICPSSVSIPDNITMIGSSAFWNCGSLISVTIPNGVTKIGACAFWDCSSLASVTIPDSVTKIGNEAFRGCSLLTSVVIPDGVTTIGSWAFMGCSSLTSVTIPDSVTTIGSSAFSSCYSLTSVAIGSGVTEIASSAFSGCSSLTSVTIPNSVTIIGSYAFSGCSSLVSITIPDSVTTIGDYAFYRCSSLTSVMIPNSVTTIGAEVFTRCQNLRAVCVDYGDEKRVREMIESAGAPLDLIYLPASTFGQLKNLTVGSTKEGVLSNIVDCLIEDFSDGLIFCLTTEPNNKKWIQTTVTNDTKVAFMWKSSCEGLFRDDPDPYDYLAFEVDGERIAYICGETDWSEYSYEIVGEGEHTIRWMYAKDDEGDEGEDCAWISDVSLMSKVEIAFDGGAEEVVNVPNSILLYQDEFCQLPSIGDMKYPKYRFVGWSDGEHVYQPGDEYAASSKILTLKAVWEEKHLPIPQINAVTPYAAESQSVTIETEESATIYYSVNDGEWMRYATPFEVMGEATISAYCAKDDFYDSVVASVQVERTSYEVRFDLGEGGESDDAIAQTVRYGESAMAPRVTEFEGYFFEGWDADFSSIVEDVVISAVWSKKSASVVFELGDEEDGEAPEPLTVLWGESVILPECNLVRPLHKFVGWTDGEAIYQPGDSINYREAGVKIHALWEEKHLNAPVIRVESYYETESVSVAIVDDDEKVEIYYTTASSDDVEKWTRYEGEFEIVGSATISAIAKRDDYYDSEVVSAITVRRWSIAEYLGLKDILLIDEGNTKWVTEKGVEGTTGYSIRSGAISDSESTGFNFKLEGEGVLTIRAKVSSEFRKSQVRDGLAVFVDDERKALLGGEVDWTKIEVEIAGESSHTIRIAYIKDSAGTAGEDAAFIDWIKWRGIGGSPERPEVIEVASEEVQAAFDKWIVDNNVTDPSAANVNAFIMGLAPNATEEEIQEQVEAEIENIDMGKLATDPAAAVEAIQAKYPNAKVELAPVEGLKTSAHLYKLVIELK